MSLSLHSPDFTEFGRRSLCGFSFGLLQMGFIFGPIIAIGTVWLYFYLPETRGRTLEEVDELYSERVPARKSAAYVCHALREKTAAFERAGGASREDTSEEKVQVEEME